MPIDNAAAPSAWIRCFAQLIAPAGSVLDAACGGGRHTRLLLAAGHHVTAVDKDLSGIADLRGQAGLTAMELDLERGGEWPFAARSFDAVVVANYLHRPLLPSIVDAVGEGGVLIYETFADGNERHGRQRRPAFLLTPGELLDAVSGKLQVIAYEHGAIDDPRPAVVQRVCAVRADAPRRIPYSAA